ncbi:MAG: RodZ domain-containing protein [Rudaea sp.]
MSIPEQPRLFSEPLGQRLAAAREACGWSVAEVASRMRLPVHILRTIESDDFGKIGAGIYLRGYLSNYARLVGVPNEAVDDVLQQQVVMPPQLVASGRISHSRYLFERYSGAALYVVLTGVIFVPLVMFAMNMGSDVGSRLLPLDVPATATSVVSSDSAATQPRTTAESGNTLAQPLPVPGDLAAIPSTTAAGATTDLPLMASFTPMSIATARPTAAAAEASGQNLHLTLSEASWVEIVDADGKRLEFGILPAGTERTYASDRPLDVRIGNTTGSHVAVNGQAQDISQFNHGNVAHFRLFAAGKGTISRAD